MANHEVIGTAGLTCAKYLNEYSVKTLPPITEQIGSSSHLVKVYL